MISIIFSKDRAMQLQATLESFLLHCKDSSGIELTVLYKVSSQLHRQQYEMLRGRFPDVDFVEETDFREQVLSMVGKSTYVLFLVDDNIFVKPFTVHAIIAALDEEKNAIGFSLRLGRNTTYCYPLHSSQSLPSFVSLNNTILKYNWAGSDCDFGYPLEVSSSVYRTCEIAELLKRLQFKNPNQLEGEMAARAKHFAQSRSILLCYNDSVTFCNPINVVQGTYDNRHGTVFHYESCELADSFSKGIVIDVEKYVGFAPRAAHQEVELYFKPYNKSSVERIVCAQDEERPCGGLGWRPKFSIIMANYNNAKYIDAAIQSVIHQTFNDWELIIVDDGSTDDSVEKIKKYHGDARVKLIEHGRNRRYTAALKTGIANINSEYFGILDSDDLLMLNAVETMYKQHVDNPDCGFIYSQFIRCNKDLVPVSLGYCKEIPAGETNLDVDCVSHFKTFKLRDYLKTSGYDESILYAEDKDIIYKMEEVTKLKFVNQCLYVYRELPNSIGHASNTRAIGRQSMETAKAEAIKRRGEILISDTSSQHKQEISKAITIFQEAQRTFASGDMVSARRLMSQYQAGMDYSKLSVIDRRDKQASPLMSVIIVTYQRSKDVAKLLDCLAGQTCRDFETIVVDNGGTDITSIQDKADCIIPCPINFNLSEGRNIGSFFARGRIAVFLDDDALVDNDYTASIRDAFHAYQILGLRGRTLPKTSSLANDTASVCDRGDKPFPTMCNQEGNSAFLLWAWRSVGGQDPLLFGHEGMDLTWRLMQAFGRSDVVMYWPKTVIYHDYGNAEKFRKKSRQNEFNKSYLSYKYETNITDVRLSVENLPLLQGDALAMPPVVSASANRWHSLCYTDNRNKMASISGPRVSVIIACYNTAEYLPQCLDSILAQTLTDWETILVDDGSTDGTQEILQRYAQKDNRFRVYYFDRKEGPYVRRNYAIQQARAPFISIQDADDIMAPVKLELMLEEILRDDSLGIVGSFYGRFIDTFRGPEYCDRIRLQVSHQNIMANFQNSWYLNWHASAIIRKDMFERIGLYDTQPWGSDTFWLSKAGIYGMLTGKVRFKNIPEVLTFKREHAKSQTGTILPNHPKSRRKILSLCGRKKLASIIDQAKENPAYNAVQAIQECNCNDFIPRFGQLFEQWESEPVNDEMIFRLLVKAVGEFSVRYYTDSLISMNAICTVCVGIEKKLQGMNLLRGLCQYAVGEEDAAYSLLQQEYQDHGTVWAIRFLNTYMTPGRSMPGGVERRQIVDDYVFIGQQTQESASEVLYDNRDINLPDISVILDCRLGQMDLGEILAEWTVQTDKSFELLIMTTGNRKEDLAGLDLPLPTAVINIDADISNAAAKNRVVTLSRGKILLFVSGQISIRPDCTHITREILKDPAAGAISGRILSAQHNWNPQWNYGGKMVFCSLDQDQLCAVKRQVYEQAGGLEKSLWGREMLSLSWAIYLGTAGQYGSILYAPKLQGTLRPQAGQTTDFLMRILSGEQLYWKRSAPPKYSPFMFFTENCSLNPDILPQDKKTIVMQVAQFFIGRHNAVALQWLQYAYQLDPNSTVAKYFLAQCQWDLGDHNAAAGWFEKVLSSSFAQTFKSTVLSDDEKTRYANVIDYYISSCLKLTEYWIEKGRSAQAQQILTGLKANPNVVLDSERQGLLNQLFRRLSAVPTPSTSTAKSPILMDFTSSKTDAAARSFLMPQHQNALAHCNTIRRLIDTFQWDQLFPDVKWDTIAPERTEAYGRYLAATVFLAIGQDYAQAKSPASFVEIALEFAAEQLEKCLELTPDDSQAQDLMQSCRQVRSQFAQISV